MATYTATFYSQTPKGIHAGINRINVSWNSGALTASNGDVILLAKLPNGSRLVDFWEDHSTGAATATMDLGLANGTGTGGGASFSCYQSAGAQACHQAAGPTTRDASVTRPVTTTSAPERSASVMPQAPR